jgi:hydroxyacylglutathione hydrolase
MAILIKNFSFNALQENTYLIADTLTKEVVIIDPGCYDIGEQKALTNFIAQEKLTPIYVLCTHGHIDHVVGLSFAKEHYKIPAYGHILCQEEIKSAEVYAPMYGFPRFSSAVLDKFLEEGDEILIGSSRWEVRYVPGHARGHLAFVCGDENSCLSGDVLFYNSVGRTDLPGGNTAELLRSIKEKIYTLPDDMKIYCGHGKPTTVGFEKKTNPFVRG